MKSRRTTLTIILGVFVSLVMLMFTATYVYAAPSLGVATGGTYFYTADDSLDWQDYFTDDLQPMAANGGNEGFAIGPSGSSLTIFTDYIGADIYLLTDADAAAASNISITNATTMDFTEQVAEGMKSANGYKPLPYFGVNLGPVNTADGWFILEGFDGMGHDWYGLEVTINYTGTFPGGSYLFAAADVDGGGLDFKSDVDDFSPKTSSTTSTQVPEMNTIYLLGISMVGIVVTRRKIKK